MRFSSIIKILIRVYPYGLNIKFSRYKNILYTHWVKKLFGHIGNNTILERQLRLYGAENIFIGDNCYIRRISNLSTWSSFNDKVYSPKINIGNYCSFGEFLNLSAINEIIIGNNVLVGRFVTIIDHNHGTITSDDISISPLFRDLHSGGKIVIDDDVWISDKVTICANVHIHKGAIIGANAVVTKDVPENAVVAGCPAKIIKYLS